MLQPATVNSRPRSMTGTCMVVEEERAGFSESWLVLVLGWPAGRLKRGGQAAVKELQGSRRRPLKPWTGVASGGCHPL